jgi:histidyl-tRNA synthetase
LEFVAAALRRQQFAVVVSWSCQLRVCKICEKEIEVSEAAKPEGERRKFRAVEGVRDILPPATDLWNWFEKTARGLMESYNFAEIRLPIFEDSELFARAVGEETDIVLKEMYSFLDRERVSAPNLLELRELFTFVKSIRERRSAIGPLPPRNLQQLLEQLELRKIVKSGLQEMKPLRSFVSGVADAYSRGEIPQTRANKATTIRLVKVYQTLERILNEPEGAQLEQRVLESLGDLLDALQSVQLGYYLTLRPEATASVCRAYIEHGMHTLPGDVKLYYIGPMFRRERPQKGRYRQFYQIGAEVLGTSDAPAIDAELIEMLTVLLARCQIEKWTLLINSIGCSNCRPKYVALLRAELRKPEIFSKLGPDSQRRVDTNPLRVMDSKLENEQPIIEKLPKITEHLCADCREHYEKLKKGLTLRKVPFTESPRLVRGLDYYMRTTFEITSPVLGAQNALCGGGRYDGLVEMLGGPKGIKGIGFALGEDRFIDAITEAKKVNATRAVDVFIAWMGQNAYPEAVRLARVLRGAHHVVELPPEEMKFRKAFERADKIGARYVLILGDDEIASKQLTLKRLADGVQEKIAESALLDHIRSRGATEAGR